MGFLLLFHLLLVFLQSLPAQILAKECTNTPSVLSSHTLRYALSSSSHNGLLMPYVRNFTRQPTSASSESIPRKVLLEQAAEFGRKMLRRSIDELGGSEARSESRRKEDFLKEISLHDVRLDSDSMQGRAQQTNLEYLLMLDVDRLVWSFRKTAGLPAPGTPYGGWEDPTVELRGHFVGHYMSASAQMWASTHNGTLHEKMSKLISALDTCQKKMGTGYLSAFPSELFDRFEAVKPVWAPYYTIHKHLLEIFRASKALLAIAKKDLHQCAKTAIGHFKVDELVDFVALDFHSICDIVDAMQIMAGLLDQHLLAANTKALDILIWMADYFSNRVHNVISKYSIERHWLSLNEETGGMNDVLYKLYDITGDQKHLELAHLFDKPCFLGLLAVQVLLIFKDFQYVKSVVSKDGTVSVMISVINIYVDDHYAIFGTLADSLSGFHTNTHIPVVVGAQMRYEVTGDPLYKVLPHSVLESAPVSSKQPPPNLASRYSSGTSVARHLFRWTKDIAYADYYERALTNGVLGIQRGVEPGVMIYMLPLGRGKSKANSYHGWGTRFDSFWCCYGTGCARIESFSKLGDSIYFEEAGNIPGLYIIQFVSSTVKWDSGKITLNQKVVPVFSSDPYLRVSLTFSAMEVLSHLEYDRPEYGSIQAILFGPYLLAGLSDGDWDINQGLNRSLSEWITAVPAAYNSMLISLTQNSGNTTLAFTNTKYSITMEKVPESGTDAAIHATFRLIPKNATSSSHNDVIGKSIMLEPLDLPEMVVAPQGPNNSLAVTTFGSGSEPSSDEALPVFRVVTGLDRKLDTISLESESQPGCFVYNGGGSVQLSCQSKLESLDAEFRQAASFQLKSGMSNYHPISFKAKGARRNFLLMPLLSLRDESSTVYFSMGA
ncbi:hypothetical protein ACLOJK_018326 [Asimina triloba]